jgi:hypothetical protein
MKSMATFSIGLLVIFGSFALFLRYVFTHGELGSKPENAALQAVEYESRSQPVPSGTVLRKQFDYHVLSVPSHTTGKLVWVLLDPRAEPYYKQMPSGDFSLTQRDFDKAASYCAIHPSVVAELQHRIAVP